MSGSETLSRRRLFYGLASLVLCLFLAAGAYVLRHSRDSAALMEKQEQNAAGGANKEAVESARTVAPLHNRIQCAATILENQHGSVMADDMAKEDAAVSEDRRITLVSNDHGPDDHNTDAGQHNGSSSLIVQGEPVLLSVAHELYREGNLDEALAIFQSIAMDSPDKIDGIDAMRMIGQIHLYDLHSDHNLQMAIEAYHQMLDALDSSTSIEVEATRSRLRREALGKLAMAHQMAGDYGQAVALRERLLEDDAAMAFVTDRDRRVFYHENARAYSKLGMYEEAQAYYKRLMDEFPDYGRDNGQIVDLEFEMINSLGLPPNHPDRLAMIERLWRTPDYQQYPQIYNVANHLTLRYSAIQDRVRFMEVAQWIVDRLDAAGELAFQQHNGSPPLGMIYRQQLLWLAEAHEREGNAAAAAELYERFLTRFPSHEMASDIRNRLASLEN